MRQWAWELGQGLGKYKQKLETKDAGHSAHAQQWLFHLWVRRTRARLLVCCVLSLLGMQLQDLVPLQILFVILS